MTDFLANISIHTIFLLNFSVLLRPIVLNKIILDPPLKSNGISNCRTFILINCIKYFKSHLSNQLIIPIDIKTDLIRSAKLNSRSMQIRHSCELFFVDNQLYLLLTDIVSSQIASYVQACLVRRVIINDDDMEIAVVLFEYAMNIPFVSEIFDIVIGWNDDAERQLLFIFAQIVNSLQSDLFLPVELLKLLSFLVGGEG